MAEFIDPKVYYDLMVRGLFTCYWCGEALDMEHIGEHIDACLRQKNLWERQLSEK